MKPRPRGKRAALTPLCVGSLVLLGPSVPVAVADPERAEVAGSPGTSTIAAAGTVADHLARSRRETGRCTERKAEVLDWTDYFVRELTGTFTSSLRDPGVVGGMAAARTMRRIERQLRRAELVCPQHRLAALQHFVRAARRLTRHQIDQTALESLLRAFDRYERRQTHRPVSPSSVEELHRCQVRLPAVHVTYEVGYSDPKPYGKDGWVMLAVANDTARDLWVGMDGWMVAVRPLPRYAGEFSASRGGHVYWWGGSSSDLMLAEAHRTTEHYASPSWYLLRLKASGFIKTVRPRMVVTFPGHLGCAAPVWPTAASDVRL